MSKVIDGKWQENDIMYLAIQLCRTNDQMLKENIQTLTAYMEKNVNYGANINYCGLVK